VITNSQAAVINREKLCPNFLTAPGVYSGECEPVPPPLPPNGSRSESPGNAGAFSTLSDRALVLVANRLTAPGSEHGLARWLETDFVYESRRPPLASRVARG
jgi:hypothetical protein